MAASLLIKEQLSIDSGYAWLVSEANLHGDSDQACSNTELLEKFDELVAGRIVDGLHKRRGRWSVRATGEVVLDVLDQSGTLDESSLPARARNLVLRAHDIARRIVPADAWNAC